MGLVPRSILHPDDVAFGVQTVGMVAGDDLAERLRRAANRHLSTCEHRRIPQFDADAVNREAEPLGRDLGQDRVGAGPDVGHVRPDDGDP
jgi:hypothetical protein